MRVITANVNGIRSAAKKGFMEWLETQNADIVCLQEVRASLHHLNVPLFQPKGFHCLYACAEKPGYSGVALYSKQAPIQSVYAFDEGISKTEGRYIEADFGHFSIVSVYFPSGTSGDLRQAEKYRFMDSFESVLQRLHHRPTILCGDWNIAHRNIDIEHWKSNQNSSGFLPEERAWLDKVFGPLDWVDAFRVLNQEPKQYTWWSNRTRAWDRNIGWRIDYQVVSPLLRERIQSVHVYRDQQFSDHAPLRIDYDLSF